MPEGDINQAVELFKSRDPRKRRWAVDLAADLGTPESAALLIKALQDQSWSLREYAIGKSARLGRPMVAPLCRLLRSGIWFSRAAAVQALRAIGDPKALGPLSLVAGDASRSVAEPALAAVGEMLSQTGSGAMRELALSLPNDQRLALASIAAAFRPDVTGSLEEGGFIPSEEQEGDLEALQRLRVALKAAAKQEPKGDDEEP